MKLLRETMLAAVCAVAPMVASAGPSWQSGNISNITSVPEGLLIMLDAGMPDNCAGSSYGWMLIPEANKTIIATTLLMWAMGTKSVTVYTVGRPGGGYCVISQVDPA